jgi:acyl-CoA synthetase (AMP-forming)/AMP-acid ligase II
MSRAGYVPQMFSLRLPNPTVIFELLQKAGARALVFEPSFDVDLSGCPVLTYPTVQVREQDAADVALPPLRADCSASDLAFVFHTSGSTSGSPKLVPCNRRWLDNIVTKSKQMGQVRSTHGQDVTVAMYGYFRSYSTLIIDLTFDSQRKYVSHWTDEQ